MKRSATRRPSWRALVAVVVALVVQCVPGSWVRPVSAEGPELSGGGSSFAKLEIDQWRAETARNPYNFKINYVAQGSSFGRQQYISGQLDFAASDIPFTQIEMDTLQTTDRKNFAYVPVSAGGLGFMYNLIDANSQPVNNLQLTPNLVCRIFTDPSMMWNDPELQAVNPSIPLPNQQIRAIVRSDGSGTSYVLSEYCLAMAEPVWTAFRAAVQDDPNVDPVLKQGGPSSNWPLKFGSALAADGVAAYVAGPNGTYGITYNEAGFAKIRGFPNASVQNRAGAFTQPTEEAVSIALEYATGRPDGTFQLDFTGTDSRAYFPSTYSYVIAQTDMSADKGLVLAKFLCYSITKGQRIDLTTNLGYARLSAPLVEIGRNAIARINGAPAWEDCKPKDAAPPPPPAETTPPNVTTPGGGTTAPVVTTPDGGTVAPSDTPSDGTTASGGPVPAAQGGASSQGGGASSNGNANGSQPVQTVISIDPVTGQEVSVTVTTVLVQSESGCVDPLTGLPAECESGAVGDQSADGTVNAGAIRPAAVNPQIRESDDRPDATKIAWWLLQGASVCGVGVALAGARKRMSS